MKTQIVEPVKPLSSYELWMVKSNLQRIKDGEYEAAALVSLLRSRGYNRVANAVEATGSATATLAPLKEQL